MTPHNSRDLRIIFYLFFKLKIDETTMPSVNEGTIPTIPQKCTWELERFIESMISLMNTSPINSPDFFVLKNFTLMMVFRE